MTEKELQQYLLAHFPRENESCEWKEKVGKDMEATEFMSVKKVTFRENSVRFP